MAKSACGYSPSRKVYRIQMSTSKTTLEGFPSPRGVLDILETYLRVVTCEADRVALEAGIAELRKELRLPALAPAADGSTP